MEHCKKEFISAFQITRKIIFEVEYYTLSNNKHAYFSTSANELNQPKTDYSICGQAQYDLLPKYGKAFRIWKKWNEKHLKDLNDAEYNLLITDINELKNIYNYIFVELDETQKPYSPNIPFYAIKKLSMLDIPNKNRKPIEYKY